MQIDVDVIDILGGEREDTEDDRNALMLSIKEHGLLQPIMVVPNEALPGRYSVVFGRRRLNAVRHLRWGQIDCIVKTLTDVQREMTEITENLHRVELSPEERDVQMAKYMALFKAQHPEVKDEVSVFGGRPKKRVMVEDAAGVAAEVDPVDVVAKQFNVSPRKVRQAVARAEKLTDEQRRVLEVRGLGVNEMDRVANIKAPHRDKVDSAKRGEADATARAEVVNLLAAQMGFEDAMKEVLGASYDDVVEDDLSDEDWLGTLPLWARSDTNINRGKFEVDALRYRKFQQARFAFERAVAWKAESAKVAQGGIYSRRASYFLDAKHPRDWMVCGNCTRGVTKEGEHKFCAGGGYVIS